MTQPKEESKKKKKVKKKGMWAWFQRNEKILLTGLVIGILPAFGFGGVIVSALTGGLSTDIAAVLDDEDITMKEYNEVKKRYYLPMKSFIQRMSSHERYARMFQKYQDLGTEVIFNRIARVREAEAAGVRVTDAELRDFIQDQPNFTQKYTYNFWAGENEGANMLRNWQLSFFFMSVTEQKEGSEQRTFNRTAYVRQITEGMKLTLKEFEESMRCDLLIRKHRYFRELASIIPTEDVFGKFKKEQEEIRVRYVRFDAKDFQAPEGPVKDPELKLFYQSHRDDFQKPRKKSFEYIFAPLDEMEALVSLSETEMRDFYEKNKDRLFKEEEKEEEEEEEQGEEEKEGEKKEEGQEKKEDGEEGDDSDGEEDAGKAKGEDPGPADEDAKAQEDGAEEPPPVTYKPLDDPEVQKTIRRDLRRKKAEANLEAFMKELGQTLKSVENRIRTANRTATRDDLVAALGRDIVFADIVDKVHSDPAKWGLGGYATFRLRSARHEKLFTQEELKHDFSLVGVRIAEKVFQTDIVNITDHLKAPEGFFLVRGLEEKIAGTPPLAEIREEVAAAYKRQKRMDGALDHARNVREKMLAQGFEKAAAGENLPLFQTTFFRKEAVSIHGDGANPPLGRVENLIATAFDPNLTDDGVSNPIVEKKTESYFLIQIVERRFPEPQTMTMDDLYRIRSEEERIVKESLDKKFGSKTLERHKLKDLIRQRATRKGEGY
jgi:hypothetical protein